jgi:hypothetical protein
MGVDEFDGASRSGTGKARASCGRPKRHFERRPASRTRRPSGRGITGSDYETLVAMPAGQRGESPGDWRAINLPRRLDELDQLVRQLNEQVAEGRRLAEAIAPLQSGRTA